MSHPFRAASARSERRFKVHPSPSRRAPAAATGSPRSVDRMRQALKFAGLGVGTSPGQTARGTGCAVFVLCLINFLTIGLWNLSGNPQMQTAGSVDDPNEEPLATHLGAAVYLVPDDWGAVRTLFGIPRPCYFNKSMDLLSENWHPHNNYSVVLLNTREWQSEEKALIREKWNSFDIEFLNIAPHFQVHNESDIFEDHGNPLHPLDYKRMCTFMLHGIAQVEELRKYRYLLRLDDDLCIQTKIPYDIFADMRRRKTHYAFNYVMQDDDIYTKGITTFVDTYVHDHNISVANPDLAIKRENGHIRAFGTHFEVLDMARYRQPDIANFTAAVVASDMIFHRRWGDAPLRYFIARLFWKPREILHLCDFSVIHWVWSSTGVRCSNRSDTSVIPINISDLFG